MKCFGKIFLGICSLTVSLERGFPLGMISGDEEVISIYSIRRDPKQCWVRNWDAPTNPATPRSACRTGRRGSSTEQQSWNSSRFSLHTSWSFFYQNIVQRGFWLVPAVGRTRQPLGCLLNVDPSWCLWNSTILCGFVLRFASAFKTLLEVLWPSGIWMLYHF